MVIFMYQQLHRKFQQCDLSESVIHSYGIVITEEMLALYYWYITVQTQNTNSVYQLRLIQMEKHDNVVRIIRTYQLLSEQMWWNFNASPYLQKQFICIKTDTWAKKKDQHLLNTVLYKYYVFPASIQIYSLFTWSQALNSSLSEWLMINPELRDRRRYQMYTVRDFLSTIRRKITGKSISCPTELCGSLKSYS